MLSALNFRKRSLTWTNLKQSLILMYFLYDKKYPCSSAAGSESSFEAHDNNTHNKPAHEKPKDW